jgi:hypothetical protein
MPTEAILLIGCAMVNVAGSFFLDKPSQDGIVELLNLMEAVTAFPTVTKIKQHLLEQWRGTP